MNCLTACGPYTRARGNPHGRHHSTVRQRREIRAKRGSVGVQGRIKRIRTGQVVIVRREAAEPAAPTDRVRNVPAKRRGRALRSGRSQAGQQRGRPPARMQPAASQQQHTGRRRNMANPLVADPAAPVVHWNYAGFGESGQVTGEISPGERAEFSRSLAFSRREARCRGAGVAGGVPRSTRSLPGRAKFASIHYAGIPRSYRQRFVSLSLAPPFCDDTVRLPSAISRYVLRP